MRVSADQYRAAMRCHPAGVVIVTMTSPKGPVGFTATSFASLSLNPPLVSFNITNTSSSIDAMRVAKSVVIHFTGADQLELAQRFSRLAEDRFADRSLWTLLSTGEPVLNNVPVWLRAQVEQLVPLGDSTLVVGGVRQIHSEQTSAQPEPLIYHGGNYLRTAPLVDGAASCSGAPRR